MTINRRSLTAISTFSVLALAVACGSNDTEPGDQAAGSTGGAAVATGSVGGDGDGVGGTLGGDGDGTGGTGEGTGSTSSGGNGAGATGGTSGGGGAVGVGGSDPQKVVEEQTGSIDFLPLPTSFQGTLAVSLSTTMTGDIHYTIDGTVPTAASPTYTEPLQLSATTQIRAIVASGDTPVGDPGSAVYLALASEITSDIPLIVLDNYVGGAVVEAGGSGFGGGMQERPFVDGTFMSFAVKDGVASLAATPDVATRAAFHVRGQSSASFEKTPYRLELRDNDDDDIKFPLLGMPTQSDWVLRGPYADKSLIRDAYFYGLGADMGMQAPKFVLVEFYLNTDNETVDENDYMGVYLLAENIKNAKARLDLAQLDETDTELPDISGGYIFKFEWKAAEEPIIPCTGDSATCWADLEVYDPLPINEPQKAYLSGHVHDFHAALHSDTWTDPTAGYAPFIDSASFVDQLIVNELGRELDSYVRSAYFHKDRDGVIVAGPLWDYNLSFGVGGYFDNKNLEGWQYVQNCSDGPDVVQSRVPGNNWFFRLMDDPAFVERVRDRWTALRQDGAVLSDAALDQRVTDLSAPLTAAAARNFQKWDVLGSETIGGGFETDVSTTWEEQIEFLRTWMVARVAWLDTQWKK